MSATTFLDSLSKPALETIENYRTRLLRDIMRQWVPVLTGLCRAGFTGGWLPTLAALATPRESA